MEPTTLALLCCPSTHQPLNLENGRLTALGARAAFPVRNGIPSLFPLSARSPRHRFWEWVYNRVAFAYDWGVEVGWKLKLGGHPISRQAYIETIRIAPGDLVLETAVGTGANLLLLPQHARYVGLDISFNMLLRCQKNLAGAGRKAELVHGDAQFLPFKSNLFDVVFQMGAMQFLSDPGMALAEALRVAKPGGRIWIVDESYSLPTVLKRARSAPAAPRGIRALAQVVPPPGEHIQVESLCNDELYHLSFRKKPA